MYEPLYIYIYIEFSHIYVYIYIEYLQYSAAVALVRLCHPAPEAETWPRARVAPGQRDVGWLRLVGCLISGASHIT